MLSLACAVGRRPPLVRMLSRRPMLRVAKATGGAVETGGYRGRPDPFDAFSCCMLGDVLIWFRTSQPTLDAPTRPVRRRLWQIDQGATLAWCAGKAPKLHARVA